MSQIDYAGEPDDRAGIPLGVGHVLVWEFGSDTAADDLTGRTGQIVLDPGTRRQVAYALVISGTQARFAADLHPWQSTLARYVLLLQDAVAGPAVYQVRGVLALGSEVRP